MRAAVGLQLLWQAATGWLKSTEATSSAAGDLIPAMHTAMLASCQWSTPRLSPRQQSDYAADASSLRPCDMTACSATLFVNATARQHCDAAAGATATSLRQPAAAAHSRNHRLASQCSAAARQQGHRPVRAPSMLRHFSSEAGFVASPALLLVVRMWTFQCRHSAPCVCMSVSLAFGLC